MVLPFFAADIAVMGGPMQPPALISQPVTVADPVIEGLLLPVPPATLEGLLSEAAAMAAAAWPPCALKGLRGWLMPR